MNRVPNVESFRNIPVIDSHVHMSHPISLDLSVEYLNKIIEGRNYRSIVLAPYSIDGDHFTDKQAAIKSLYLKHRIPGIYAQATLNYNHDSGDTSDFFLSQVKEHYELGFDGEKLLEGKPDTYRQLGHGIDDPVYDGFYEFCEEKRFPITLHVADPPSFWDPDKVSEYAKKVGWFYADPSFPTREELYRQVWNVMNRFPALPLILAHFGFLSDLPDMSEEFLTRWKNTALDLTPGGWIFSCFSEKHDYWRDFFVRHSSRIVFGTDSYNTPEDYNSTGGCTGRWALVRSCLEFSEPFFWNDSLGTLLPLGLDDETLHDIYNRNSRRIFGEKPAAIDIERADFAAHITSDTLAGPHDKRD